MFSIVSALINSHSQVLFSQQNVLRAINYTFKLLLCFIMCLDPLEVTNQNKMVFPWGTHVPDFFLSCLLVFSIVKLRTNLSCFANLFQSWALFNPIIEFSIQLVCDWLHCLFRITLKTVFCKCCISALFLLILLTFRVLLFIEMICFDHPAFIGGHLLVFYRANYVSLMTRSGCLQIGKY